MRATTVRFLLALVASTISISGQAQQSGVDTSAKANGATATTGKPDSSAAPGVQSPIVAKSAPAGVTSTPAKVVKAPVIPVHRATPLRSTRVVWRRSLRAVSISAKTGVNSPTVSHPTSTGTASKQTAIPSQPSASSHSTSRPAAPQSRVSAVDVKAAASRNADASAESHRAVAAGGNSAATSVAPAAHALANTPAASKVLPAVPTQKPADPVLTHTKPDTLVPADATKDHTLDSPFQAVGEGWKMVAYLLPMLIFIVVCLNLLRRFQQKNGRLPGVMQAAARGGSRPAPQAGGGILAALFSRNQAVRNNGSGISGIRVLESVPVGTSTLHLVQVRGRVLLLAGSGAGVTVLTEFEERPDVESDEFRGLLQAAAADMDALDLAEPDLPVTAVVSSLEDVMRDTGESMARRLRRLRTVQEAEDAGL